MQEFTLEQIGMQVTALQNFFDQVTLIDPLAQAEVDPANLQATGHTDAVPVLNADGRSWQPILGEDTGFVFYQNIQVEHRPFVLAATYFLTADLPANDREANALLRLLGQYREEMRRDYVTGVHRKGHHAANGVHGNGGDAHRVNALDGGPRRAEAFQR